MAEHKESGIFIVLRCIQADLIAPKGSITLLVSMPIVALKISWRLSSLF